MNKSFRNIFLALLLSASSMMTLADDEIGTVFITGANRGIGLEFTKQYLERGWTVIATARKPEKADDLKQLEIQYPDHLTIQQLDVTDHERIDALAEELEGQPIDLLLNNAGTTGPMGVPGAMEYQKIDSMDYQIWRDILEVNLLSPFKICLLYTSPSPRDKRQSRMPSSA